MQKKTLNGLAGYIREIHLKKAFIPYFPGGGGGGGWWCSNIFAFHTYVGSGYFLGFKILNFFFFLGGGGYEDFMDIFLGSSQNWASFRRYFYAFWGLFLRSMYRIGLFFGVAKISNIFLGA